MTYAIAQLNGKQYQFQADRYVDVDFLHATPGTEITLDQILVLATDEKTAKIGTPMVAGATVTLKVESHHKAKKVLVYKMRCKKGYRLKNGHRQNFSRVRVVAISG